MQKININYVLFAVIVHQGQINSGHYFTYINDIYNKQWVKYNDKIKLTEKSLKLN